jgi:hypothetical protein
LATKRSPIPKRDKSNCRTVAKSDSRWWALTLHRLAVPCLRRSVRHSGSTFRSAARSQPVQGVCRITSRKRERESLMPQ